MPSLIHCIYASAATRAFETAELAQLLQRAREKNAGLNLTGMLLHVDGSFFQVLEGPDDVVHTLYASIQRDPRHHQVTSIIVEPIARRSFEAWTMGFSSVSREALAGMSGVNDFFDQAGGPCRIDAGRAKKLLSAFREGRWRTQLAGTPLASA